MTRRHYCTTTPQDGARAHDFGDWRQVDDGGGTGAPVRRKDRRIAQSLRGRWPSRPRKVRSCCLTGGWSRLAMPGELARIRPTASWNGMASARWRSRGLAQHSAELRAPLCSHTEHIVAEAVDAFAGECAVTLAMSCCGACRWRWAAAGRRPAAAKLRRVLEQSWDGMTTQSAAQLEAFESERSAFLRKPPRLGSVLEAAAD